MGDEIINPASDINGWDCFELMRFRDLGIKLASLLSVPLWGILPIMSIIKPRAFLFSILPSCHWANQEQLCDWGLSQPISSVSWCGQLNSPGRLIEVHGLSLTYPVAGGRFLRLFSSACLSKSCWTLEVNELRASATSPGAWPRCRTL